MQPIRLLTYTVWSLMFLISCNQQPSTPPADQHIPAIQTSMTTAAPGENVPIDDYWHQGKAELNRYDLQQNRYREVHPGEAVLVFVLEDFLTDVQVKNDRYVNPNSTPVLKTNAISRFTTGLYDYSIMNSIFTPFQAADFPHTLKVTNTVQDWCGQVYTQLNAGEKTYRFEGFSYFESEGDVAGEFPLVVLEDELFNRIRMNPGGIPTGKAQVLPSLQVIRLLHLKPSPQEAQISMGAYTDNEFAGENLQALTVDFLKLRRTLTIVFEGAGTHQIVGWTDASPSVFDGQIRETVAKRTNVMMIDYWSKNKRSDEGLREDLGLNLNPGK